MVNPIEVINLARKRAGRVAALDAILFSGPVCLLTALIALLLGRSIGQAWSDRMGITLSLTTASHIRIGLLALTTAGLAVTALRAYRAYHEAENVERLAAQIDAKLKAREEVLTFATLVVSTSEHPAASRSSLFPILWRRVSEYLASFDPARHFRLNKPRLLVGSAVLTVTWTGLLIGALVLFSRLERPPYYYDEARQLAETAQKLEKAGPGAQALARRLRAAAAVLANPNLSAEQKLEQIAALNRELEQNEPHSKPPQQVPNQSAGARGTQAGQGSAKQSGDGAGTQKQGQGEGGQGGKGSGSGEEQNAGMAKDNGLVEQARNELAKTEKQLAAEVGQGEQPSTKTAKNEGQARSSGSSTKENPSHAGNQQAQPSEEQENKNAGQPGPRIPEKSGTEPRRMAPGQGPTKPGTAPGDTRLGETPAPTTYARFYKPGEHGPPLGVKDAHFVVIRVPETPASGGGGKIVAGGTPPKATTPYANLPLPAGPIPSNPEERQLIPPRYRDLLH
jgi:hypothetical protein